MPSGVTIEREPLAGLMSTAYSLASELRGLARAACDPPAEWVEDAARRHRALLAQLDAAISGAYADAMPRPAPQSPARLNAEAEALEDFAAECEAAAEFPAEELVSRRLRSAAQMAARAAEHARELAGHAADQNRVGLRVVA